MGFKGGSGEGGGEEFGVRLAERDRSGSGPVLVTASHSALDEAVLTALARLALTAPDAELRRAAGEALAREYLSNHERTSAR
jgi:hypothetical protein